MPRFYFDHNATTPISGEVLEVHARVLLEVFGNASSIHQDGQRARRTLDEARRKTAALLRCDAREVAFTSGGTESDNLALFGIVRSRPGSHCVTTAIEHPAVLRACDQLEREGHEVTRVRVGSSGVVDPGDVRDALKPNTALISVMHVNNEIGTIQPLADIAKISHEAGIAFHSDGVQAAGRIPVDVRALGVDLYAVSGHKMHAPKGVGALYVRKGMSIEPLLYGGRHENGLRAGTENVPGAAAFGAAAEVAHQRTDDFETLRTRLEQGIVDRVPDVFVNGSKDRVPNTSNICFEGIEGEALVIALDLRGFAVSSGSACSSGAIEPSHVLTAIGRTKQQAKSSVRFSLGRENNQEQVDALIEAVVESVSHLRRLSPTYVVHA